MEPGDGGFARDHPVAGNRRQVGGGGPDGADGGDDRLLARQIADGLVQRLAAGGRAAGGIDRQDHRLDAVRLAQPAQELALLPVVGNHAGDGDARDLFADPVPRAECGGGENGDHRDEKGDDAPER